MHEPADTPLVSHRNNAPTAPIRVEIVLPPLLERLIEGFLAEDHQPPQPNPAAGRVNPDPVRVYACYRATRVDALLDIVTGTITITTGPLKDKTFLTGAAAARNVVTVLNPTIKNATRNGYDFWKSSDDGKSLRQHGELLPPHKARQIGAPLTTPNAVSSAHN